jgi:hypothetical protein
VPGSEYWQIPPAGVPGESETFQFSICWKGFGAFGSASAYIGAASKRNWTRWILVRFEGDRDAWLRRLGLIRFDRESVAVDKVEAGLPERLPAEEGPGILNLFLEGLQKVRKANQQLRLSEKQSRRVIDLLDESEAWVSFLNECLEKRANSRLTVTTAYRHFVEFASAGTGQQFRPGSLNAD